MLLEIKIHSYSLFCQSLSTWWRMWFAFGSHFLFHNYFMNLLLTCINLVRNEIVSLLFLEVRWRCACRICKICWGSTLRTQFPFWWIPFILRRNFVFYHGSNFNHFLVRSWLNFKFIMTAVDRKWLRLIFRLFIFVRDNWSNQALVLRGLLNVLEEWVLF